MADDIQMGSTPTAATGQPEGLLEPGNLNINGRPSVLNSDGKQSTEYSTSFGDDKGREILVPTIVNGKFLTPDGTKPREGSPEEQAMFKSAQKHYEDTHEHLGIFDSPENATAYARALHNRDMKPAAGTPSYVYSSGPVVVKYPSGHSVQFPSEVSAHKNSASVWEQLKDWKGLQPGASEAADKDMADFHADLSKWVDKAKSVRNTINDFVVKAGEKGGQRDVMLWDLASKHPDQLKEWVKDNGVHEAKYIEQARQDYPRLMGVTQGASRFAAGLATPEQLGILVAMPEAEAYPLLKTVLGATFTAMMATSGAKSLSETLKNWNRMNPTERYDALTSLVLHGVATSMAAHGTGESAAEIKKPSVSLPSFKGESGEASIPGTGGAAPARATEPTAEEGLTAHGAAGASVEELARNEKFLRISPSGLKEYQGVSPDPSSPLRLNEAIIAVKPDGTWRYQAGNTQIASDVAERAIKSYMPPKPVAKPSAPVPERGGTTEGAMADTGYVQQAKAQLGPNASVSEVLLLAQKMKVENAAGARTTSGEVGPRKNVYTPEQRAHVAEMNRQLWSPDNPFNKDPLARALIEKDMRNRGITPPRSPAEHMGSGIPEVIQSEKESVGDVLKRLKEDESGFAVVPFTGNEEQRMLPFKEGDLAPADEPDAPVFYSHALDTINEKVQNNMSGDQIKGVLINNGVKPDEMHGTGLEDFLKDKAKVSKSELQQFMKENQLQLREINYGGHEDVEKANLIAQHRKMANELDNLWNELHRDYLDEKMPVSVGEFLNTSPQQQLNLMGTMAPETRSTAQRFLQTEQERADIGQKITGFQLKLNPEETENAGGKQIYDVIDPANGLTRFTGSTNDVNGYLGEVMPARQSAKYEQWRHGKQWADEGGLKDTDYTEKLLLLPEKTKEELAVDKAQRVYDDFSNEMSKKYTTPEDYRWYNKLTPEEVGQQKQLQTVLEAAQDVVRKKGESYTSSHWHDDAAKNPVAHIRYGRVPEMTDKPTMILHEAQSDWNTDIRTGGYKGEKAEIDQKIRDLEQKKIVIDRTQGRLSKDQQAELEQLQTDFMNYKKRMKSGEKLAPSDMSNFRDVQDRIKALQTTKSQETFTPQDQRELERLKERQQELEETEGSPVANGPLVQDWHELAMKRTLREAADQGYDRIVWPTGQQQAELYGLYNHVKALRYDPYEKDLVVTKFDGSTARYGSEPTVAGLARYIGRDLAEKMVDKIDAFHKEYGEGEGQKDPDALSDEQIYDMMREPYSIEQDDTEPTYEYTVHHDGEQVIDDYFESEREAEKALKKWWEENYPDHDMETGEYTGDKEGDDRPEDVEPPKVKENEIEQEPSFSVFRDGDHVDTYETERQAERAMESLIEDDVNNYDGPRESDEPEQAPRSEWPRMEGLDLHTGGEFHKLLYDTMIPSFLKNYTKKWGAKVGMIDVPNAAPPKATSYSGNEYTIKELENQREAGDLRYYSSDSSVGKSVSRIIDSMKTGKSYKEAVESLLTSKEATEKDSKDLVDTVDLLGGKLKKTPQSAPMHFIELTPQMKRALTKGKGQKISRKEDERKLFGQEREREQAA